MESMFEATVAESDGGPLVVMAGTVNRAAKEALETAYDEATKMEGRVLLDFRGVDYINSTGIAVIVGIRLWPEPRNAWLAHSVSPTTIATCSTSRVSPTS